MATFSIIGAGAVGGYFGARLAEAGNDVTFVFRGNEDYVREHGFTVSSPLGDIDLKNPDCVGDMSELKPADYVIVAVKATANPAILPGIASTLNPEGTVLLIQNGINQEPLYAAQLSDKQTVIGASALIAAEFKGQNHVDHFSLGALEIGTYADGYAKTEGDARAKELADIFQAAKVPVNVDDNLLRARWQKLIWNAAFNPTSVLTGLNTKEMTDDAHASAYVKRIMLEVLAAAQADGCTELTENELDGSFQASVVMDPYFPSMKVDFDNGRVMEADAILGEPIERGKAVGVDMPALQAAFDLISAINGRL